MAAAACSSDRKGLPLGGDKPTRSQIVEAVKDRSAGVANVVDPGPDGRLDSNDGLVDFTFHVSAAPQVQKA
jgi:hypothetical protein